jgi:hypothetical protein
MYYLCHAYLPGDGFYPGRQAILQEMIVGDDNWVRFAGGSLASIKQPMPFSDVVQERIPDFEDDFRGTTLKKEWAWNYVSAADDVPRTANVLCVRPATPHYTFETQITGNTNGAKGLTIYGDDKNRLDCIFAGNKIQVKMLSDNQETILGEQPVAGDTVSLKIEVTKGCHATCYWSKDGTVWEPLGDASTDCSRLVRWDRIARPGLIHTGKPGKPTGFAYFALHNLIDEYN